MSARFSLNIKFCYRNNWCVSVGCRVPADAIDMKENGKRNRLLCVYACIFNKMKRKSEQEPNTTGIVIGFVIFLIFHSVRTIFRGILVWFFLWHNIKLMNYKEYTDPCVCVCRWQPNRKVFQLFHIVCVFYKFIYVRCMLSACLLFTIQLFVFNYNANLYWQSLNNFVIEHCGDHNFIFDRTNKYRRTVNNIDQMQTNQVNKTRKCD